MLRFSPFRRTRRGAGFFPSIRTQRGASKAEYILIVASIAILAIGVFMYFGDINRQHASNLARELGGAGSQAVSHRGAEFSRSALADSSGGSRGGGSSSGGRVSMPGTGEGATGSMGAGNSGSGTGAGIPTGTGPVADNGALGGDGGTGSTGRGGSSWTSGLPGGDEGNALWDPVVDPGNEAGGEFCEVPGGNAPTLAYVGNPINLATGNKFQRESDFRGTGEFPLRLVRSYNSVLSRHNTGLGAGWQHNYQRRIGYREDGLLQVVRADGRRHLFRRVGEHWVSTDGNVDRLIDRVRNGQAHQGWEYLLGTGGRESYDADGRLERLEHAHGQQQVLQYDAQGLLSRVTDAYGQQLSFHYQDDRLVRVDRPDGWQQLYRYDEQGNLAGVGQRPSRLLDRLARKGNSEQQQYHYEDSRLPHHLTGLTDADGQRYARWAYDHQGRAILSEHGDGVGRVELDYQKGKTLVTNAAGHTATYHLIKLHGIHRVSRIEGDIVDGCPETRQQQLYADSGFIKTAIDGENRATLMERDRRGLITEEIRGARWQEEDQQAILQPESLRITRQWHPRLPLVTEEIRYQRSTDGQWQAQAKTENSYDERGRLIERRLTNLSEQQQPYANQGTQRRWTYQYSYHDAEHTRLKQIQVIDPRQQKQGQEQEQEQESPLTSQFDYNEQGQLIQSRNVLGHVTRYSEHNLQGQPGRILDPNGLDTRMHYNEQGQLTRIQLHGKKDEHTSEARIHYRANGLPERIELPDGQWLQADYSSARQLTGLTNQRGERIELTPNKVSEHWEQLSIQDAEGTTAFQQQRELDQLGRVIVQLGNAGQQTHVHYDRSGKPIRTEQQVEDKQRLSNLQQYDALGRLIQHTDPLGGETRLEHDPSGQIRSVTAANDARTSYLYDGLGQLLQESSPDTGIRVHEYDQSGQRIRSYSPEHPEQVTRYHYDALGRLVHIQHPDAQDDIRYHYDLQDESTHGASQGRLSRIEDRHSRIDFVYDTHGNLIRDQRRLTIDQQTHQLTTEYRYTSGNQLAGITYPNGQQVTYHYHQGQLDSISLDENSQQKVLVSDIRHRPFGPIEQWRNGNGLIQQLEYDLDGRITEVRVSPEDSSGTKEPVLWHQQYRYDLSNNITGIQGKQARLETESYQQQFGYDHLQRLTQDQGAYGEHDFTYDAVGNRLSHTSTQGQQEQKENYRYAPASNRLLGTSNQEITLDELGNLLRESKTIANQNSLTEEDESTAVERSYHYNGHNRISEYHENGKLKARYHYNALGQRIHKAVIQPDGSEQHTLFHYGQNGELLSEIQLDSADTATTGPTQNIVWLHMRPVVALDTDQSHNENSQITWLHSDHLLTARAATDQHQNLIWRWHSDAFGVGQAESLTANGTVHNNEAAFAFNLRFPGQYYDAENGLHYNYFRTYDPQLGRYTQSDPIGLLGGMNTFAYVGGSPINWADPLGLARLQYIMIDNYGGNPANAASRTVRSGVDMRLQHFAFYLTGVEGAEGHSLIYDPNGTFAGLNANGAIAWDSNGAGATDHWANFSRHYTESNIVTGDWASQEYSDADAIALFEALAGYNPLNPDACETHDLESLIRNLPILPEGFKSYDNYKFPAYVNMLDKPIFFEDQMLDSNDNVYTNLESAHWGKTTFDGEGNDKPGSAFYSRKPSVPNNNGVVIGNSGVTIGRGYDFGSRSKVAVKEILIRIGLPSGNDFDLLVGSAGKTKKNAYNYLYTENAGLRDRIVLTREQQYLLFLESYQEERKEAERLYETHVQGTGLAWSELDEVIKELLTDMKFRGDFRNVSATNYRDHEQLSADFRSAVFQSDSVALCRVFVDNKDRWMGSNNGWGVPKERFKERIVLLGGTHKVVEDPKTKEKKDVYECP